jgi:hypothetical protein
MVPGLSSATRKLPHAFRAADSSLVGYRLPIDFLGQLPQAGRVAVWNLPAIVTNT